MLGRQLCGTPSQTERSCTSDHSHLCVCVCACSLSSSVVLHLFSHPLPPPTLCSDSWCLLPIAYSADQFSEFRIFSIFSHSAQWKRHQTPDTAVRDQVASPGHCYYWSGNCNGCGLWVTRPTRVRDVYKRRS